jgi:hypothetical protein
MQTKARFSILACAALLSGCVAAIGNTGYTMSRSKSSLPLLEQRAASAQRIVDLRQSQLDELRAAAAAAAEIRAAEIALEEARLAQLECQLEVQSVRDDKKKD